MSLCPMCGITVVAGDGICPWHTMPNELPGSWAEGNRVMCDFFHRGILRPVDEGGKI